MITLFLGYIFLVLSTIVVAILFYLFMYVFGGIFLFLLGTLSENIDEKIVNPIISLFDRHGEKIFTIYLICAIFGSFYVNTSFICVVYKFIKNIF